MSKSFYTRPRHEAVDSSGQGIDRRSMLKLSGMFAGAVVLGGPLLAACSDDATSGSGGSKPKAGGVLKVGVVGAGTKETLNPYQQSAPVDLARTGQVYQCLNAFTAEGQIENVLAESFEANPDGTSWTIKLRKGVVWHDGKPFNADDVIYSFNYILDNASLASSSLAAVDQRALRKIDETTIEVGLKSPNHLWPQQIVSIYPVMIQNGTKSFEKPVGTGPFKFQSWSQGKQAVYVRNADYWQKAPYLERVEILSIEDATARTKALQSGQINVCVDVPSVAARTLDSNRNLQLLSSPGGTSPVLYMVCDSSGPVGDVRVRQAIKHLFKRDQVVTNAYGGYGKVGNDLTSWFDENYASDLPQREFNPDKAAALLKDAGYSDLSVTIQASELTAGLVGTATLLAESAKEAGVKITVNKTPSEEYLASYYYQPKKTPIGVTYWTGRTVAAQISAAFLPDTFNESNFSNATFNSSFAAATAAKDAAAQKKNLIDCQEMLYNEGGFLIPAFGNALNAAASTVKDLPKGVTTNFAGYNFGSVWIDS